MNMAISDPLNEEKYRRVNGAQSVSAALRPLSGQCGFLATTLAGADQLRRTQAKMAVPL